MTGLSEKETILEEIRMHETAIRELKRKLADASDTVHIKHLDLEMRTYNCLLRSGFTSVQSILDLSTYDLLNIRGLGSHCYHNLRKTLIEAGFLDEDNPTFPPVRTIKYKYKRHRFNSE